MHILITGGAGFIGSHLAKKLIESGHSVVIVDDLSSGSLANIHPNAKFYELDILKKSLKNVFINEKPDIVFHLAAQIDVRRSLKNPVLDGQINICGTLNVLKCCSITAVKKIIFTSTAAVYGEPEFLPLNEGHPLKPVSSYGISKHAAEHYIQLFSNLYKIRYTILRFSNVYGQKQTEKGEGGVIAIFLDQLLKGEKPVIFGDGCQTRDFIYVPDVIEAMVASIHHGDSEIINIGTGKPTSVSDLFKIMKNITQSSLDPVFAPPRQGEVIHNYLDVSKAKKILDWLPVYSLEKGLQETLNHNLELELSKKQVAATR